MKTLIIFIFLIFYNSLQSQNTSEEVIQQSQKSLDSLVNIGLDYIKKDNLSLSIIHLNKALKLANSLNDLNQLSKIYNAIGVNYHLIKDIENANLFYKKSFEAAQKGELYNRQATASANISQIKYLLKNYQEAEKFALLSIKLCKTSSNTYTEMMTQINLINIYMGMQDLDKAKNIIVFLDKNIESIKKHNLLEGYYLTLAKYYEKSNNNIQAQRYYEKSILLKDDRGFVTTENIRLDYANFLYKNNNYQKAFLELKKQLSENEKVMINEKKMISESIGLLKNAYQTTEELETIKETNLAITYTLHKYKLLLGIIITLFLISIATAFFLYRSNKIRSNLLKIVNKNNLELKEAHQKTTELSAIKSNFITTITHEIRTPLYGIIGLTKILKDKNKSETDNIHLKSLDFSANYLLSLINDILVFNTINEKEKTELAEHPFNIETEVNLILQTLKATTISNNNQCIIEIDTKIPKYLLTDKVRLTQIFVNLLSNALKFTQNGTVTFKAQQLHNDGQTTTITFSVIDTGKGISEENQQKIFDKFVQIEREENDYLGTGLGLSIVSNLIAQFNSKLIVESKPNVGSVFQFTITLKHDKNNKINHLNPVQNTKNLPKELHVLVVEDNKINQLVTQHTLKKAKIATTIVDNGFRAIEMIKTQSFDLILMDLNMPEINGFETAKEIRKFNPTIPIIALTAFSKEEVLEKITKSGINNIITKPFEAEELIKTIQQIIS